MESKHTTAKKEEGK